MREAIFARLTLATGARVLDLYAGTGALGIEALSRGAERLVCVDRAARSVRAIEKNLARVGAAELAQVIHSDARGAIRRLGQRGERFDVVFLDPPYEDVDGAAQVLADLVASRLLAPGAVVVVESAKRHAVAPVPGLRLDEERRYGDTLVRWLRAEADAAGVCPGASGNEGGSDRR